MSQLSYNWENATFADSVEACPLHVKKCWGRLRDRFRISAGREHCLRANQTVVQKFEVYISLIVSSTLCVSLLIFLIAVVEKTI